MFRARAILLLFTVAMTSACAASSVQYGSADDILKRVKDDRGHVVVVNFWATWCVPCVAEYSGLVTLDRKFKSRGLVVIAVSLDFGEDATAKVRHFVKSQHAQFPQYILQMSDPETAINAFDPTWQGDLPRTFIYGRSGKLVKILSRPQSARSFVSVAKAVLAAD
jgi:thiol-disulfide isomerase/thioredoxin